MGCKQTRPARDTREIRFTELLSLLIYEQFRVLAVLFVGTYEDKIHICQRSNGTNKTGLRIMEKTIGTRERCTKANLVFGR